MRGTWCSPKGNFEFEVQKKTNDFTRTQYDDETETTGDVSTKEDKSFLSLPLEKASSPDTKGIPLKMEHGNILFNTITKCLCYVSRF